MSFTATLFRLIRASGVINLIHLNGYEANSIKFKSTWVPPTRESVAYVEVDLGVSDQDVWMFYDQEVEVDSGGFCEAQCTDGDTPHSFEFRVSRPIRKGDLS